MKFKNVKPTEDGVTFDVEASHQEVAWLVDYAVDDLLKAGIIAINTTQEEQEIELDEDIVIRH